MIPKEILLTENLALIQRKKPRHSSPARLQQMPGSRVWFKNSIRVHKPDFIQVTTFGVARWPLISRRALSFSSSCTAFQISQYDLNQTRLPCCCSISLQLTFSDDKILSIKSKALCIFLVLVPTTLFCLTSSASPNQAS